jgi:hypothetical protein
MMKTRDLISSLGLCLGAFLLLGPSLPAQTASTGALTITVTDPSGAAIAGASLTVTSAAGQSRKQLTEANGSYTFALLPVGNYQVSIAAAGFKTALVSSVAVNVAETHVLSQALEVGTEAQNVTVTSATEMIQTESSSLGGVVGTQAIVELPLATRNYTQILGLSPGVVSNVNDASQVGRGSQYAFVNGTGNISTSYQMDGVSITDLVSGGVTDPFAGLYGAPPIPSPDALQEFKVQTSLYDAGYGHSGGANVNVVTKTGTNQLHGSLFEFVRNDIFNANGFFQNRTGLARGELKQNQFGGTIGGPIKRDKLFYFFSYQGTRQVNGVASQGFQTVSLPEQLTNNRSASALGAAFCPANNPAGSPGARYANTYLGTPGNPLDNVACDGSNINPIALNLLNAKLPSGQYVIPSPQTILNPGTPTAVGFAAFTDPATFNEDQAILNLDYQLTPKNTLSERFYYAYGLQISPFDTAGQPPGGGLTAISGDELYAGRWTALISDNMVNEAHFSYLNIRARLRGDDPITAPSLGITPSVPYWTVMPIVSITSLFSFGGQFSDTANVPEQITEWSDQLSWNHGRHTLRLGFDEQYVKVEFHVFGRTRGTLTFQTWPDLLLGYTAAQNGTSQSNIYTTNSTIQAPGGTLLNLRENYLGGFAQDDFKVTPKLTFNLGLRWEYNGTPYDLNPLNDGVTPNWNQLLASPIPSVNGTYNGYTAGTLIGTPLPPGIPQRSTRLYTAGHSPFTNFSPRIGFAWQPISGGKWVVRGGFGIFYVDADINEFTIAGGGSPPSAASVNRSGASNALASWSIPYNPTVSVGFIPRFPGSVVNPGYSIDPQLRPGTLFSQSLNIQYAIRPSLALEVGYLGNRGEHLITMVPLNIPALASPSAPVNCGYPSGCITTNTTSGAGSPANRSPVQGMVPFGLLNFASAGDSEYSAVQATLRKNFSHGLQFQASYTFGRTFTDISGSDWEQGGTLNSNDPTNHAQLWGPADFDRPQRLIVSYYYGLPAFSKGDAFLDKALSGWGISGVTTAQSGNPLTITDSRGGAAFQSTASRAQLCPGMTKHNIYSSGGIESRLNGFFNANAFCSVPLVANNGGDTKATGYGNSARTMALGPGQYDWDLSLVKKTVVGGLNETGYLEFRSEFFNAFNHPQFSSPTANDASSTFGYITSTSVGPRIIQFALKYVF